MRLSDDEILAVLTRFKKLANSSTMRSAEGVTLGNNPLYMRAFAAVMRAREIAKGWDGPRDELDLILKKVEESIVSDMKAADALVKEFPPGTGNTFGHTNGTPSVEDDCSACHKCGEIVRLDLVSGPRLPCQSIDPGPVFLKLETGRDVLLFVMHTNCFERVKPFSEGADFTRKLNAGLDFVRVGKEEWMLLLVAKDVLSS